MRCILTSVPTLLLGFFASVYALTSTGWLDSADEKVVALTAWALLLPDTPELPTITPDAVAGSCGDAYSIRSIAQGLVEIPLVRRLGVVMELGISRLTYTESGPEQCA